MIRPIGPLTIALTALTLFACNSPLQDAPAAPLTQEEDEDYDNYPEVSSQGGDNAVDADTLEALKQIGYVDQNPTETPDLRGVTVNKSNSHPGLNLYTSRKLPEADLLDMEGNVLHSWRDPEVPHAWMHIEMRPNGQLIVISKGYHVTCLDWDSTVVWRRPMPSHHDFVLAANNELMVLTRSVRHYRFTDSGPKLPVLSDWISYVDDKGQLTKRRPLFPLLREFVHEDRVKEIVDSQAKGHSTDKIAAEAYPGDVFHTNSIELLSNGVPGIAPPGSILISVRELNRIFIVDPNVSKILWSWGRDTLQGQHHATLLANNNIMVFDNGVTRGVSRVLEISPSTREVVWEFSEKGFYTRLRGSAQQLPNGNVLATLSDTGRAVEITRSGERVWEFYNPDVTQLSDGPARAVMYRLTRYPADYLAPQLREQLRTRSAALMSKQDQGNSEPQ